MSAEDYSGWDTGGRARRRRTPVESGRGRTAAAAVSAAVILGCGILAVRFPVPYVVESPGPAYNVLGADQGKDVIEVEGRESFPASGGLDLTTVYVNGGPNSDVSLLELARSWFDDSRSVIPEEVVYPVETTREEIEQDNSAAMVSSQQSAVAAAMGELGIDYEQKLSVMSLPEGSPSSGKLEIGDRFVSVGGVPVDSLGVIQQVLAAGKGNPVSITVLRDGKNLVVEVTPSKNQRDQYVLGVTVQSDFSFPFDVRFQLDRVGGPSAGMMFALGVVDKLTPGDLTGGKHVAGTGTITTEGVVGGIGGIVQKMHGARDAGATLFLAPGSNCSEVVGRIPEGLAVARVDTLEEARSVVEDYATGKDPAGLQQCR